MAGEVERQHYVPVSYLNRWVPGGQEELFAFDKTTGKVFRAKPKNIGVERWFYHVRGEDQKVERALARIEGKAAPIMDRIVARGSVRWLNGRDRDRRALERFLAAQLVRTHDTRKGLNQTVEKIKEMAGGNFSPELEKQINEFDARAVQLEVITESGEYVPLLENLHLMLLANPGPKGYSTSDNPIFRDNNSPFVPVEQRRRGLASEGVEVHLPLSPAAALLAVDPDSVPPEYFGNRMTINEQHLIYERWMQFVYSDRFIYSGADDFELEKTWAQKHPDLADPDRPRTKTIGPRPTTSS